MSKEQTISTMFDGEYLFNEKQRSDLAKINAFHLSHPGIFWTCSFGDEGIAKSLKIINSIYLKEWIALTPFWHVEHFNYKFINSNKDVK